MSPQGEIFEQRTAIDKSQIDGIIVVCGRYEGFDERFIEEFVDFEWSVGDYIVSGGELPALTCLDAIIRNLPTVVNNAQSILDESFLDGTLDYPQYTRPELVDSLGVPSVLLSGNHSAINSFRKAESLRKTYERRPKDLLVGTTFSEDERKLLAKYFSGEDRTAEEIVEIPMSGKNKHIQEIEKKYLKEDCLVSRRATLLWFRSKFEKAIEASPGV